MVPTETFETFLPRLSCLPPSCPA